MVPSNRARTISPSGPRVKWTAVAPRATALSSASLTGSGLGDGSSLPLVSGGPSDARPVRMGPTPRGAPLARSRTRDQGYLARRSPSRCLRKSRRRTAAERREPPAARPTKGGCGVCDDDQEGTVADVRYRESEVRSRDVGREKRGRRWVDLETRQNDERQLVLLREDAARPDPRSGTRARRGSLPAAVLESRCCARAASSSSSVTRRRRGAGSRTPATLLRRRLGALAPSREPSPGTSASLSEPQVPLLVPVCGDSRRTVVEYTTSMAAAIVSAAATANRACAASVRRTSSSSSAMSDRPRR